MTTIDTDVTTQPASSATDSGQTVTPAPATDPVVRLDGELAARLLCSARWQQ